MRFVSGSVSPATTTAATALNEASDSQQQRSSGAVTSQEGHRTLTRLPSIVESTQLTGTFRRVEPQPGEEPLPRGECLQPGEEPLPHGECM